MNSKRLSITECCSYVVLVYVKEITPPRPSVVRGILHSTAARQIQLL